MRVLFVSRHPKMGHSIARVFSPIEVAMREYCDLDSISMPAKGYSPLSLWRNIVALKRQLRDNDYDVVHITGTENYLIPFIKGARRVVTLHDMGSLLGSLSGVRRWLKRRLFVDTLRDADLVTSISDSSMRELPIDRGRCVVIENPVDPHYQYAPKRFNAECPVVLHIGTKRNKNLSLSIEALAGLPCHLRMVGTLDATIEQRLVELGIDYSHASGLTHREMLEEYHRCDIVNFPSTYEGFGMPIIEGQAVGRVVVTSDLSPMREVAGGGAILVDPFDIASIAEGYREAVANHSRYIERGLVNVCRFGVEEITRQYYLQYKNITR